MKDEVSQIVDQTIKENPLDRGLIVNMSEKVQEYISLGMPYGKTQDNFFDWYFDVYIDVVD